MKNKPRNVNTCMYMQGLAFPYFYLVKNLIVLAVLKTSGVSIGSFWSNIMTALAVILSKDLTSELGLIEKVTNPCPVVPLFGGKNPTDGFDGGKPVS